MFWHVLSPPSEKAHNWMPEMSTVLPTQTFFVSLYLATMTPRGNVLKYPIAYLFVCCLVWMWWGEYRNEKYIICLKNTFHFGCHYLFPLSASQRNCVSSVLKGFFAEVTSLEVKMSISTSLRIVHSMGLFGSSKIGFQQKNVRDAGPTEKANSTWWKKMAVWYNFPLPPVQPPIFGIYVGIQIPS